MSLEWSACDWAAPFTSKEKSPRTGRWSLPRIEGTLQERPEDGRFNETPVGFGRINEQLDLLDIQRDRIDIFEKPPIKALDGPHQSLAVTPGIHRFPKGFQRVWKRLGIAIFDINKQIMERLSR